MAAIDWHGMAELAKELAPWAGVAIAWIAAHKASRANENSKEAIGVSKEAVEVSKEAVEVSKTNTGKIEDVQGKLEEVHKTINGRVEEIRQSAKKEGILEERVRQQGGP